MDSVQDLLMVALLALGFAGAVGYVKACMNLVDTGEPKNQQEVRKQ